MNEINLYTLRRKVILFIDSIHPDSICSILYNISIYDDHHSDKIKQ